MGNSASTDTFPALPADVAEVRRAAGITIAPEAALHRALQERTDELERVRAELREAYADRDRWFKGGMDACAALRQKIATLTRERDEAREYIQPSAKALAWAAAVFGP